jgi:hypothetical protein
MATNLNGAGSGFLSVQETNSGLIYTVVVVVAAGTYPTGGELWEDTIHQTAMKGMVKVIPNVKPDNVFISANLGHLWFYDRATNTLRNWLAVAGGTPTEHANGAYGGNEVASILTITAFYKKFASISSAVL